MRTIFSLVSIGILRLVNGHCRAKLEADFASSLPPPPVSFNSRTMPVKLIRYRRKKKKRANRKEREKNREKENISRTYVHTLKKTTNRKKEGKTYRYNKNRRKERENKETGISRGLNHVFHALGVLTVLTRAGRAAGIVHHCVIVCCRIWRPSRRDPLFPAGQQRARQQQRQHQRGCQWHRRQQKLFARAPHPTRVYALSEASGCATILPRIIRMPWKRLRRRGMCRSENRGFYAARSRLSEPRRRRQRPPKSGEDLRTSASLTLRFRSSGIGRNIPTPISNVSWAANRRPVF